MNKITSVSEMIPDEEYWITDEQYGLVVLLKDYDALQKLKRILVIMQSE